MSEPKPTDEAILAAVGKGSRTHGVAARASRFFWGQYIYRRLRVLEKAGKVRRVPQYTFDNSIYWERT